MTVPGDVLRLQTPNLPNRVRRRLELSSKKGTAMSKHEEQQAPASLGTRLVRGATSGRARATMSVGIVLGLGAVGTLAAWTDNATATSGVFSTGSIEMKLNGDPGDPTAYGFTTLTKTGMMPGDSVTATLPVQNTGAAQFKYTLAATATGEAALAPFMKVTVLDQSCTTAIAGPLGLSTTASTPIITAGRQLAATTGSETLCFKVTLDPGVTTALQSKSLNVSFQFAATTA